MTGPDEPLPVARKPVKPAGWIVLACLCALLLAALVYAFDIWNSINTQMSGWGWSMLVLGIVVTTALGVGLMALVFYSSRSGRDI